MKPEERERLERMLSEAASAERPPESLRRRVLNPAADHADARSTGTSALLRFLRFGTAAAASFAAALLILLSGGGRGKEAPPAAPPPPMRLASSRVERLASIQEAVVGSLVAKDEEGRPAGELGLRSHTVSVEILDGVAKTTVEENFQNHTDRRLEGTFRFPLPPDASISRLALEVNGKIEEGTCLEREKAREVFESIVRRMKDPALLEWMPVGIFQCRIFPIEPRATKRVIVAYTQALPYFRGTMTYVYPLASEKTKAHPPEELRIDVDVKLSGELKRIESPSHKLDLQRARPNEARASFAARNLRPENDFVLTIETADDELRVIPHKVDGDDGYFALSLVPRGAGERGPGRYAFVLDVSASVTGPELEVARRVVRAMMENRTQGDRFEVIAHHIEVEQSGEVDLRAANDFMDRLSPVGGCDLVKGLLAAPAEAEIVYVGSGTPTYGETETAGILEALKGRRIRSVAVGSRANLALLERLGATARIGPNDAVGRRCLEIAATLGSPALSDIKVDGGDALYDVVGVHEIHYGERLLVTGRYRGPAAKLTVTASGGYRRELEVAFPAKEEGHNYVRRLWAQRKIADLLALPDKKAEVTALGVKHQIMTPYTSFLVLESEQMWKDHQLQREVQKEDKVLVKREKPVETAAEPSSGDTIPRLLQEGTDLYKLGKFQEASSKFEEAFQMKPSSDQVYAFWKRIGDDQLARIMNHPDRKMQDVGRRIYELSKPGEHLREGNWKEIETLKAKRNEYWAPENLNKYPLSQPFDANPQLDAVLQVHARQTEVQLAQIQELTTKVEEHRVKLAKALNEKTIASAEMQYARQMAERLSQDLAELEEKHVEMAREKRWLEVKVNHLNQLGVKADSGSLTDLVRVATARNFAYKARFDQFEGQVGAGFSSQEVARQESWDIRAQTFHTFSKFDPLTAIGIDPFSNRLFNLEQDSANSVPRIKDHDIQIATAAVALDPISGVPMLDDIPLKGLLPGAEANTDDLQKILQRMEESRANLTRALNTKGVGSGEMGFARQQVEKLSQDLAELEAKHVDMARGKKHLEEKLNHLNMLGVKVDIAPKKPLEAKVTAVANEIGLVVISIGKDDGVLEGDEFTVYRGGDFVAKIQVDRADRRWSAGKVVLKKSDPRPGDEVSNHIYSSAPRVADGRPETSAPRPDGLGHLSTDVLETDGRTLTLKLGLQPGMLMTITRDRTFVAIVLITETVDGRSRGLVWRGIAVDSIRAGDQAQVIADPAVYVGQLPAEAKKILASRRSQEEMRGKMGW